jgi:structure-specific recognition protein 1
LERGFIFVNKPPLHILFSDISFVKFDRSQQGTRSFDFEIEHKNGTKYVFNGIEKTEQEKFSEFLKVKEIKIAKTKDSFATNYKESNGKDHDAYAERMKAEGRQKEEGDEDDDDDEEDEDFEAGSESDEDIEYDSDASIDSGSSDESDAGSGEDSPKKKKASKEKSDKGASKSKDSKKKSPVKRKSGGGKDKAKKSKSADTSRGSDGGKVPKSAEFIEDSGTDSD